MVPNSRWRYAAFQWVKMDAFPVDLLRPIRNHRSRAEDLHLRGRPKHCAHAGFPECFCSGNIPQNGGGGTHTHVLFSFEVGVYMPEKIVCLSQIRYVEKTPLLVGLTHLHVLQLSSYSQIDTIICFIKCHVNVPSESPCYLLFPSAAFNKFSSYDLVLQGTTSSDSFLCTLEGKRSPKSFNSRFQQSEWNKQNHSLGRTNESDKEMRKHLFSRTSPLLVVPFLSPTDPE